MKKIKLSLLAFTTIVLFAVALTFTFDNANAAFPGKKAKTEQTTVTSVDATYDAATNNATVATATETEFVTTESNKALELSKGLLILIAIFWPTLAVAILYDFDFDEHLKDILINLLLTVLCYVPGLIHAIIHINREK
jgi:uncharacterized membrane protein YqaE (UPF0057 family)